MTAILGQPLLQANKINYTCHHAKFEIHLFFPFSVLKYIKTTPHFLSYSGPSNDGISMQVNA